MRHLPPWSHISLLLAVVAALAGCAKKDWVARHEGGMTELTPYQRELALGANRYELGKLEEADKHLREAEKQATNANQKARAQAARGAVAIAAGKTEQAESFLRKSLETDPRVGDSWVHLSRIYLMRADTLGAIAVLDEGRRQAPGSPQVEAVLGRVYYQWGGYEQAVLHLERAVERQPAREQWRGWLAEARQAAGQPEPAPAAAGADTAWLGGAAAGSDAAEPSFEPPSDPGSGRYIPVGPMTHEPTAEELAQLETRARRARRASALKRADFAVLLAAYGPTVRPWPSPRDLPPDAVNHPDAPYIAVALLGRWLRADLEGLVHPDSLLTREEAAVILDAQVRRYPALQRLARELPEVRDVPYDAHNYEAVAAVAASGLLPLAGDGRFRPHAPLTGEEGAVAAERLRAAVQAQGSGLESRGSAGG